MGKWFGNLTQGDQNPSMWQGSNSSGHNLRKEFNDLVLGQGSYQGIGQFMALRVMDRDGARCPCWNATRGSSSNCKYCKGESFAWTEKWVRGYFTQTFGRALVGAAQGYELRPAGYFDHDKALMYLPAEAEPLTGDAVFRIKLNVDGKPYYPIERVEKWRAVNVEDRRQERGELAFWLVLCERVEF